MGSSNLHRMLERLDVWDALLQVDTITDGVESESLTVEMLLYSHTMISLSTVQESS